MPEREPDFIASIGRRRVASVATFTAPIVLATVPALFGAYFVAATIALGGIVLTTVFWRQIMSGRRSL